MPGPEPDVVVLGGQVTQEDVLNDHAFPTLDAIGGFALRLQQLFSSDVR